MLPSHGKSRIHRFREAARSGDLQSLQRALEVGGIFRRLVQTSRVDVNDCRFPSRSTALMDAAAGGHRNVVEYLLSKKADVCLTDWKGRTAMHYAVFADSESASIPVHNPVVHALIIGGVDVDATDWNDVTALDIAFSRNNVSAAYTLSSAGARAESPSNSDNIKRASTTSESIMETKITSDSLVESIREVQVENDDIGTYALVTDSPECSFLVGECYAQEQGLATSMFEAPVEKAIVARPIRRHTKLKASLPQPVELQTKISQ